MHLGKFEPLPDRRFSAGVRDYRESGQPQEEYFVAVRIWRSTLYIGSNRGARMENSK